LEAAMKTKSIRIPEEIVSALEVVKHKEKIEESSAMRKLIRIGFETYLGNLYKQGKITLREAANLLGINQIEAMDIFLDSGIKGNLLASDILFSIKKLGISEDKLSP
jgi:predicted HTH domain antitoxin